MLKKSNKDTFVEARPNLIGKKIKMETSLIASLEITLKNNEVKNIMKVLSL